MTINTVYDPKLWLQPSTPTPAMRAEFRDAARALLNAEAHAAPFRLLDAEDDAAEQCDPADAADLGIGVGDVVSVYPAGAWEPRMGYVRAISDAGMFLVQMQFGALKWWYERDVRLVLVVEAVEVGGE